MSEAVSIYVDIPVSIHVIRSILVFRYEIPKNFTERERIPFLSIHLSHSKWESFLIWKSMQIKAASASLREYWNVWAFYAYLTFCGGFGHILQVECIKTFNLKGTNREKN